MAPRNRAVLTACFVATGLSSLVCEVVWLRKLTLAFGATKPAVSLLLAIFMAGLGIGSLLFGRLADRRRDPLRVFAALELGLAGYIAATPWLFDAARSFFSHHAGGPGLGEPRAWLLRIALGVAILLPPTTLMGGTLPLLVKHLAGAGDIARLGGRLYAVNTLGAVIGCGIGVVAPQRLGLATTLRLAAAIDALVAAVAFAIARQAPAAEPAAVAAPRAKKRKKKKRREAKVPFEPRPLLAKVVFAATGFFGLALEGLAFRMLALVLGSSAYAFGLMLAIFLAGLALGAGVGARLAARARDPALLVTALLGLFGAATVLAAAFYFWLPYLFRLAAEAYGSSFGWFLLVQGALAALVLIGPTLCLGAAFPAALRLHGASAERAGSDVGGLYLANTAGSIAGSVAAGYLLIPLLGTERSVTALAIASVALAGVVLKSSRLERGQAAQLAVGFALVMGLALATAPRWNRHLLSGGPYVNTFAAADWREVMNGREPDKIELFDEGGDALVSVHRAPSGALLYRANGKTEAVVSGRGSTRTWSLLGHLPLLLAPDRRAKALLVGLGAGITLGAMEQHDVERIDVVEIEPAVVRAAHLFDVVQEHALDDARVKIYTADGRAYLGGAPRYDVIISGVSDPWIRGVSNLFTLEYFRDLAAHLEPGGVACVWLQNYRIGSDELKTTLATLTTAFPEVSLWYDGRGPSNLFAIGGVEPLRIDVARLEARAAKAKAALEPFDITNGWEVLPLFVAGRDDLVRYAGDAPHNTDDHPLLELSLPLHQFEPVDAAAGDRLLDILHAVKAIAPPVTGIDAHELTVRYGTMLAGSPRSFQARQLLEAALAARPGDAQAREVLDWLDSQ